MTDHEHRMSAAPDPDTSPIFVVGTGRSGTTLLRLMLNAHPRIYLTHEAAFYVGGNFLPRKASGSDWMELYFKSFSYAWLRLDPQVVRDEVAKTHPDGLARDERRIAYSALMRCMARRYDKPRHGDKTPFHATFLKAIFRDYPDARVVHILRDPRATVHSLSRMPWAPGSMILNNRYCRQIIRETRPFLDRIFEIRLEDLLGDAREVMRGVLEFVGEPWDDRVLDHTNHAPLEDTPPFPWLLTATKKRDAAPRTDWIDAIPPEWIRQIEHRNRIYFEKYGYERAELAENPSRLARFAAILRDIPETHRFLRRFIPLIYKLTRTNPPTAEVAQNLLLQLNPRAWSHYPDFTMPGRPSPLP
jgi:hypothetical protein